MSSNQVSNNGRYQSGCCPTRGEASQECECCPIWCITFCFPCVSCAICYKRCFEGPAVTYCNDTQCYECQRNNINMHIATQPQNSQQVSEQVVQQSVQAPKQTFEQVSRQVPKQNPQIIHPQKNIHPQKIVPATRTTQFNENNNRVYRYNTNFDYQNSIDAPSFGILNYFPQRMEDQTNTINDDEYYTQQQTSHSQSHQECPQDYHTNEENHKNHHGNHHGNHHASDVQTHATTYTQDFTPVQEYSVPDQHCHSSSLSTHASVAQDSAPSQDYSTSYSAPSQDYSTSYSAPSSQDQQQTY